MKREDDDEEVREALSSESWREDGSGKKFRVEGEDWYPRSLLRLE